MTKGLLFVVFVVGVVVGAVVIFVVVSGATTGYC